MDLLQYTFFQHALIGSLLASIACGLIGTYIVTRRLVFISGGLTHASFGGIGLGLYTGISPIPVSYTHLELTNLSAREFIKNIRLQQAAALLKEKKLTVSEVAYATGYTNLSHFSSSFKEAHGVSPKEYMQMHQES